MTSEVIPVNQEHVESSQVATIDDLWRISQREKGKARYELVRGELRRMSPAGWLHGDVAHRLARILGNFIDEHQLGMITAAETGYVLSTDEDDKPTVRAPDVGFILAKNIPEVLPESGYVPFAPDLAVEVVSPGNTIADIDEKVRMFLAAGTALVWVVYPQARAVHVHHGETTEALDMRDTLNGGDLLPGLEVPLTAIFR